MTPPLPAGFTDVQTLAETGHGTMYQATVTTADGRADRVAVVLAPAPIRDRAARRRLRADCLAVTPVNGEPGILAIRELSFTSENQPYLVSDPAPHGTLAQRLERSGPLSVGDVAAMAQTLTRALSAAHGLGVLHLGIGPDAVFLLSGTPSVALGHFGLAWAVRPPSQPDVAAAAVVHAPRESFGWDEPTTATDAYSLASTLRTALVGQAPYAAEAAAGRAALYHRVLQGGPAPMARPDVPAALLTILDRMLDPEPAKRPGLDELGAVLEAIARGNGSVLSVPPLPRPGNMPIPTVVPTLAEPLPATLVVPTTAIPTPAQVQPTVVLPQAAPMPHASLPPGYPP